VFKFESDPALPGVRVEGIGVPQPELPLMNETAHVAKSLVIGAMIVSFAVKRAPHTAELATCATKEFLR